MINVGYFSFCVDKAYFYQLMYFAKNLDWVLVWTGLKLWTSDLKAEVLTAGFAQLGQKISTTVAFVLSFVFPGVKLQVSETYFALLNLQRVASHVKCHLLWRQGNKVSLAGLVWHDTQWAISC